MPNTELHYLQCPFLYKNNPYYDPRKGYLNGVASKDCRKIYNDFDISKIFSDGQELIFYRLTKYLSPQTNFLCKKNDGFEFMDMKDIMKVTNRGETTIRRLIDKALKNRVMAVFIKSYDEIEFKMYAINPFAARAGSGWINVFLYQLWKKECRKYLKADILHRLEQDSIYGFNVEPFYFKNGKLYESKNQIFKQSNDNNNSW